MHSNVFVYLAISELLVQNVNKFYFLDLKL